MGKARDYKFGVRIDLQAYEPKDTQELIIEMRNPNVTWRIIWHVYLFTTELRHTCSSLLFLSTYAYNAYILHIYWT